MADIFNLVTPSSSFKSWNQLPVGPGSIPGPSSSSPPSGQSVAPSPPQQLPTPTPAPTQVFSGPLHNDPMDTTEDYPGFGTLGPPQAAFVYQRIIYPAICAAFGEPDPSEIPAYAFYPGPFVVPAAYRQQQQVPSASVVNFTTNFFASARAAAAAKTAASTYRARY